MHKAKYCIVTCIDFRMQNAYTEFLKNRGISGDYDLISLAGCTRDLVKPLSDWHKDSVLRQIDLSVNLHEPETIIFLDHQDCGGYAQDGTINSGLPVEEDLREHKDWGKLTKSIMEQKYPDKNIEVYFVQLDGKDTQI